VIIFSAMPSSFSSRIVFPMPVFGGSDKNDEPEESALAELLICKFW